jgi:hypothetical protein
VRGHVGQNSTAGTWYITYDEPRTADGRRRQRKKAGFASQREAERHLTSALASIDQGRYVSTDSGTVGHFLLDEFLPSQGHLRLSTRRTYEGYLRNRIFPGHEQRLPATIEVGLPLPAQTVVTDVPHFSLSVWPPTSVVVRSLVAAGCSWWRGSSAVRGLDLVVG